MEREGWENWGKTLKERITGWLIEEARETEEGYFCLRCGEKLMTRIIYFSIHDGYKVFGICAGGGRVHRFQIPECPNVSCFNHRPSFWDGHFQLDSTDTLRGPCIDC